MSQMMNLSRLMRVDLRDIWVEEAGHFTPWLARDENITLWVMRSA